MSDSCKDRDLLAIEPEIFTGGGFESQQLRAGADGVVSATTFSLSLIHISEPRDRTRSRMPSSA